MYLSTYGFAINFRVLKSEAEDDLRGVRFNVGAELLLSFTIVIGIYVGESL